jgi:hypothetical protein
LLLEEIQKDGKSMLLFTEIGDDGARSADSLLGTTIIIELGQSSPGTRVISSLAHDGMDFTFGAESLQSFSHDKFVVLAVFCVAESRRESLFPF